MRAFFVRRVVVLGTSGAGKSTVAAALAALYSVPHIDLDDLAGNDDFRGRVELVLETAGWVVDGDFQRVLNDSVLRSAQVAVWLDLPLRVSLARMWRRTLRHRLSWEPRLARWVLHEIRSHLRRRMTMAARLSRHHGLQVVHLRSQDEIDTWLATERKSVTNS